MRPRGFDAFWPGEGPLRNLWDGQRGKFVPPPEPTFDETIAIVFGRMIVEQRLWLRRDDVGKAAYAFLVEIYATLRRVGYDRRNVS